MASDSDMDMDMDMTMTMVMEMQMTFYNDHEFTLWFDDWDVDDDSEYYGAIAGLFFLGVALEFLTYLLKCARVVQKRSKIPKKSVNMLIYVLGIGFIFFLWTSLAYLLMLAVMIYSTGIFFAVTTGITLGHVIFAVLIPLPGEDVDYEQLGEYVRTCH